ncbi:MAG: hypothetical protein ACXW4C_04285 [Nitrospira sp.]
MKRSIYWYAGMGILLLVVTIANANDEEVPLDKIPKPVMAAINAQFIGAAVTEADKEEEDGELVYEISLKIKGQTVDVILTPEGEIRLIEKMIAVKDMPPVVAKSLADNYPKHTCKKLEEVTWVGMNQEHLSYYEALIVTARKKTIEVKMASDGTIVKEDKVSGLEEQLTVDQK